MKLLLAGGGDADRVVPVDEFFVSQIDRRLPVLYIPVAAEDNEYEACAAWFRSTYEKYGIQNIEVCTDLKTADMSRGYSAVFIGGGNTYKLLKEIRESGFDTKILDFLSQGGLVYGGSAGSIIFGKDIKAAAYKDENTVGYNETAGLNLVKGFDICCHYAVDEDMKEYRINRVKAISKNGKGTIALPEDCAVFVEDGSITFMGSGAVLLD